MSKPHTIVADLTGLSEAKFKKYGERLFNDALPEVAEAVYNDVLNQPLVTTTVHEATYGGSYTAMEWNQTEVTDLAVGDLVLAHTAGSEREELRWPKSYADRTIAEMTRAYSGWYLYVVTKRTPKGAEAATVQTANRHWSHGVTTTRDEASYVERWQPSSRRTIFKTGMTLEQFTQALDTHPQKARLDALLADCAAWDAEHDRRREIEQEKVDAVQRPLVEKAKQVTAALGDNPFYVSGGTVRRGYGNGWETTAPVEVLRATIVGRNVLGEIDDETAAAGLVALADLMEKVQD